MTKQDEQKILKAIQSINEGERGYSCDAIADAEDSTYYNSYLCKRYKDFYGNDSTFWNGLAESSNQDHPYSNELKSLRETMLALFMVAEKDVL